MFVQLKVYLNLRGDYIAPFEISLNHRVNSSQCNITFTELLMCQYYRDHSIHAHRDSLGEIIYNDNFSP